MQLIREYGGLFRTVAAAMIFSVMGLAGAFCAAVPAHADFNPDYDTATYDWVKLGTPKFINTNYIDLRKITRISKFRSHVGHDYSDSGQFGTDYIKIPGQVIENCRSMKHYFSQPDETVDIFAPVSGVISRIYEEELGTQIHITADDQPAFTIAIFHIKTDKVAQVGDRVTEGQHLGTHFTSITYSDMAVMVHTPTGYHLVSYFEALTDAAFAPFKARGLASPADASFTRAQADASAGCALFTQNEQDSDFITLTGGAASQTITLNAQLPGTMYAGDPPLALNITSSAGLPVTLTPVNAKVCLIVGNTLVARRAGLCTFTANQSGDPNTFAARVQYYSTYVLAAGAPLLDTTRLAGIYPPAATGPQSYIRVLSGFGYAGTIKMILSDAATGKDLFTWSGAIPGYAAPQFSISDMEKQAPPGFTRPALYGLRLANDSALGGYIQHVLYRPTDGTFTNVTACQSGMTASPSVLGNVHSSKIGSIGFPSWLVVHNTTPYDNLNQFLNIYDSGTGATLATAFQLLPPIRTNAAAIVQIPDLEAAAHINPANIYQYTIAQLGGGGLLQDLVINQAAGIVTDMSAMCGTGPLSNATVADPLRAGVLFSSRQATAQSYLRFYNMGTTAGTVTVILSDSATGTLAGTWTSPSIRAGAEQQVALGDIESAIGGAKYDFYELQVSTAIDGYFQHVLYSPASGTLTNLSTCLQSTSADPYTVIGVHSSLIGANFPSTITVVNAGTAPLTVPLGIYDARDGSKIGSYTTGTIPAGAQITLSVPTLETAAHITPAADEYHYVIKADQPFAGFLQHTITNIKAGAITDMSTICLM